jgi:hypothetical protein
MGRAGKHLCIMDVFNFPRRIRALEFPREMGCVNVKKKTKLNSMV